MMSRKPIKIQLCLPSGDPQGDYVIGGRTVKIHQTAYITQSNGIIELSGDWRTREIKSLYVYDEKGKRARYKIKRNKRIPRDGDGIVQIELVKIGKF